MYDSDKSGDKVERDMAVRGELRARSALHKKLDKGNLSGTQAGVTLTKQVLAKYMESVATWVDEALSGKAGRYPIAATILKDLPLEPVCYIAVKSILDAAVQSKAFYASCRFLARRIELELLNESLSKSSKNYRNYLKHAKDTAIGLERQAYSVIKSAAYYEGTPTKMFADNERLILGAFLIDHFIDTTGVVQYSTYKSSDNKTRSNIIFDPKIEDWYKNFNEMSLHSSPYFMPMTRPPKPWEGVRGGGFWSKHIEPLEIVTKPKAARMKMLEEANLDLIYKGLNTMQETPWTINTKVLDVQKQLWEVGADLPCMPLRHDKPLPEKPEGFEEAEHGSQIRRSWRNEARKVYDSNVRMRSNRFRFAKCIALADAYRCHKEFYYPYRLDFRGRAYAVSTDLQPQGADHSKGLLMFAEGKPLDARGRWWLGIHGANLFGEDKISLEARAQWAEEYHSRACEIAEDPYHNLDWTEADDPWQFLGWCFEWAEVHKEGFVSHLPVGLDGSCNGLQHFSALLRDEVGGAATNLVPAPVPADIYKEVAKRAEEILSEVEGDDPNFWMAQSWLVFGIDRKITKRSVMTLPYGVTYRSHMWYVEAACSEKIGNSKNPFGDHYMKAVGYLSTAIWQAISDVVIKGREVMAWLQEVARTVSKHNLPIHWTTPSGFVVRQEYKKATHRTIKTRFQGGLVYLPLYKETDKIDGKKQASAIAPNFVHSLDASALMYTLQAAKLQDVNSFSMVHDSFATHAADTEILANTIRASFVTMYECFDVLNNFREEVQAQCPEELPPMPECGNLDIRQVLQSDYFFA